MTSATGATTSTQWSRPRRFPPDGESSLSIARAFSPETVAACGMLALCLRLRCNNVA
jgi:hypothetical protein